jgi:hypothetical protein
MIDRILKRAAEGRSHTPEPMGWIESLAVMIGIWIPIFAVLLW